MVASLSTKYPVIPERVRISSILQFLDSNSTESDLKVKLFALKIFGCSQSTASILLDCAKQKTVIRKNKVMNMDFFIEVFLIRVSIRLAAGQDDS